MTLLESAAPVAPGFLGMAAGFGLTFWLTG